jgi:hypothetical protein
MGLINKGCSLEESICSGNINASFRQLCSQTRVRTSKVCTATAVMSCWSVEQSPMLCTEKEMQKEGERQTC